MIRYSGELQSKASSTVYFYTTVHY